MKVWGFWPKIISPIPARYLLSDSLGVLVRHSQTQKCLQINSKPLHYLNCYVIVKTSYSTDFSAD